MPRYKLTLEYDGGDFVGWQRQSNGYAVQQAVEEAVQGFSGAVVTVHGAGRTDAGVHAIGQVAHFDLDHEFSGDKVRDALNFHLRPNAIVVTAAQIVLANFDSRLSAIARHYLYRMTDRRPPLALRRGHVWHARGPLNADAMHLAAQGMLGKHDFTTFRAVQCQATSPIKTLDVLDVSRQDDEIHVWCIARSFLHHQVRSIVGSLHNVGLGKWTAQDLRDALEARDRSCCGPVAPAEGLYLAIVDYPIAAVPPKD